MALHAESPGAGIGRLAEDAEVIFLRVALGMGLAGVSLLELLEHVFQAHDRDSFDVALLAQPGAQQRMRQRALRGRHIEQRQAFALTRDEVPVQTLLVLEREGRLDVLLRR